MKKIKKYYPLIVGLVLLISVAAYGTRAYFSDSTSEESNINLTLGTVDVTAKGETWKYVTSTETNEQLKKEGSEIINPEDLGAAVTLTNARPGDSFKKEFIFENTGTLDQILIFKSEDKVEGIFNVSWELNDSWNKENDSKSATLNIGDTKSVKATMVVTVNEDNKAHQFNETDSVNNNKNSLNNFIGRTVEVQAVQTNANLSATDKE